MANLYSQYTYDATTQLQAAGLVAATQSGSTILDLGDGMMDVNLVLDISAIEVATGDEIYQICVVGSASSTLASGKVTLARISLGNQPVPASTGTNGVGRYVIPFRNEQNGVLYRYIRLDMVVAGTIASGINLVGWVAKDC